MIALGCGLPVAQLVLVELQLAMGEKPVLLAAPSKTPRPYWPASHMILNTDWTSLISEILDCAQYLILMIFDDHWWHIDSILNLLLDVLVATRIWEDVRCPWRCAGHLSWSQPCPAEWPWRPWRPWGLGIKPMGHSQGRRPAPSPWWILVEISWTSQAVLVPSIYTNYIYIYTIYIMCIYI